MCGIVGIVESEATVNPQLLESLNDSLRARGPDGAGYYYSDPPTLGMAMRRLSIIDLAGGWQPLHNEDRTVAAMQNGEIYNYRTLRAQLEGMGHQFATKSDTEILAHGYEQWGIEGLLERLDGMYALAVYDARRGQLHLARDRFGEKPLYYHASPGRFVYGSQLLTVASYPGVDTGWDREALHLYLALHFVPGDATVFRGVRKVRPGHYVTVKSRTGAYSVHRYWRLQETQELHQSPEELHARLDHAVKSRLVADVPVGVFLSGGLDSSVIAALAARHMPRIATFSMGFSSAEHDESAHAALVARALGTDHHYFQFDGNSFVQLLPRIVAAMDEPVGDQALLPLYWLCSEAARVVKVVLSGEGADELFAGYSYYNQAPAYGAGPGWKQRLHRWLGRDQEMSQLLLASCQTPSGFPLLTSEAERCRLLGGLAPRLSDAGADLTWHWQKISDPLRRACLADIEAWLCEDLLMKLDKMAMAHSLEGRAPYLEPGLATAAWQLPREQKIRDGQCKVLLRDTAQRLLPPQIRQRRKQGFVLPMAAWLRDYLSHHVSPPELAAPVASALDPSVLEALVTKDLADGVTRERLLYALVVLSHWAEHAKAHLGMLAQRPASTSRAA
jgi:asparagine synthase (glutamine-hydrolysing)